MFTLPAQTSDTSKSNNQQRLNSIYFEVGGVTSFNSINIERMIPFNSRTGISVSSGFSVGDAFEMYDSPSVPINIKSYYKINAKHLLDAGIGFTPWYRTLYYDWASFNDILIYLNVGYRFSFFKNKWNIGLSFTPEIFQETGFKFIPWGGLRIGYRFDEIEHKAILGNNKSKNRKKQNISSSIGFYNMKLRLQYERCLSARKSLGVQLNGYYGWFFYGIKSDFFLRFYMNRELQMKGVFVQAKVGMAMFNEYEYNKGYVFGGGFACGYKFMIGNHLCLESILGLHLYNAPQWTKGEPNYIDPNKDSWHLWYNTIGHPLDYQLKLGWQW